MTRLVKLLCVGVGLSAGAFDAARLCAQTEEGPNLSAPLVDAPPAEESETDGADAPLYAPAPQPFDAGASDAVPTVPSVPPLPPAYAGPQSEVVLQPAAPAPLLFRASDILRPEVLKGAHYEIGPKVTLENYRFVFEVRTNWGMIKAHGMPMLELRLQEMKAIDRARLIARDPQLIDGILHAIKMTPKGAYVVLTDPIGSIRRIPQGLQRTISTPFIEADQRAGSDVRRRIAVEIGCDPETTNPILVRLLDEMSMQKGIGSLAAQVGMNVALPGLALLPVTAQFKETLATKLPHEIIPIIDAELAELGVAPATRARFTMSRHYTTTQKLVFMHYLRRLPGEHRAALVEGAADVSSEAEALSAVYELKMLLDLSKSLRPVRYEYLGLPVAVVHDGSNLIVTATDYIHASPQLDEMLAAYRRNYPEKSSVMYISGRVTPEAQAAFRAVGIQVLQR